MKTSQQWIDPYFGSHSTYATFTQNELEALVLKIQKDTIDECDARARRVIERIYEPEDDEDDDNSPKTFEDLAIDTADMRRDIEKGDLK